MNYIPRLIPAVLASLLISCASTAISPQKESKAPPQSQQLPSVDQRIPLVELKMGKAILVAEIAKTKDERMKGLSGRRNFPIDGGMLFIFDSPGKACMWMKDTLLPLSMAYINAKGKIVQLTDMQANTETAHCADEDILYAAEAHIGWFDENGVTVGTQVHGLPDSVRK